MIYSNWKDIDGKKCNPHSPCEGPPLCQLEEINGSWNLCAFSALIEETGFISVRLWYSTVALRICRIPLTKEIP